MQHVQRENGILIGVVTDRRGAEGRGRVRVRFPYLEDELSTWAKICSPMAGKNRGLFFRPEVDDELLVAFEMGDPRRPYVLGALWSKTDTPPADDGNKEKNNWRFIRSRSGHVFKFDDTNGAERIELIDKDAKLKLVIDTAGDTVQIVCNSGSVEVKASSGKIQIDASTAEIKTSGDMTLQAGGQMTIKGSVVNIN